MDQTSRRLAALLLTLFVFALTGPAAAEEKVYPERDWGLGMIMRGATIPFATDETRVASLVPMMWYQGDYVYFLGTEGGATFYKTDKWRFSALGRMHFFDIPEALQNEYQGDTIEAGLQARYQVFGPTHADLEFMGDFEGNAHWNIRYGSSWNNRRFQFHPYAELKIKSKSYNTYYFGLDRSHVGAGADLSLGMKGTYHFVSNIYLYGEAKFTLLDRQARNSEFVNKDGLSEIYLGAGLSNDRARPKRASIGTSPYWRVAHGWATPSSLADIFNGVAAKDEYNNQMTSVFYGQPVADRLFGLPLHVYVGLGFVWHHKSEVQDHAQEFVGKVKIYYTLPLPVRLRLGAAEGVSYVNSIPYVEETQLGKKGYKPSKLLNFLDFSATSTSATSPAAGP